jgi:hypothetical protein
MHAVGLDVMGEHCGMKEFELADFKFQVIHGKMYAVVVY